MKNNEALNSAAEQPKRLDFQEEEIDALLEGLEEVDQEKAVAVDPEKERAAEFRMTLMKGIESSASVEVGHVLTDAQKLSGDEMISLVIDRALEVGGVKGDAKPETIDAFMANTELRAKAKSNLLMALEAKMTDPEVGNDVEKVARLEKAIGALEA